MMSNGTREQGNWKTHKENENEWEEDEKTHDKVQRNEFVWNNEWLNVAQLY